jgi:hypothetical protein
LPSWIRACDPRLLEADSGQSIAIGEQTDREPMRSDAKAILLHRLLGDSGR